MRLRTCSTLLLLVTACATVEPLPKDPAPENPRLANLQRAAALPWTDEGRCVVQESSQPWPVLMERCFGALETQRLRFHDPERRCAVASAGVATVPALVGICLLSQPQVLLGAVVVIGVVVVALAIKEELDAYELRRRAHPEPEASRGVARPVPPPRLSTREPLASGEPTPRGLGNDLLPPGPPDALQPHDERPECRPIRVPPKGGNNFHNQCANNVPGNAFAGANVLVNGKTFDALQLATRTLWEVKTTAIETYNAFIQRVELEKQIEEGRRERDLAANCGYQFVIGVRTQAHKTLLESAARDLTVVLMPWCSNDQDATAP